MGRSPCCEKEAGLKKGPWTPEEDEKLLAYIDQHGHGCWRSLPSKAGLRRCGKSCRLRWTNYLRPDIKRGKFTPQEEQTIVQLHALLGNRWSAIATHLPRRKDNEIKNYWNTHLKRRLAKIGIDLVTHKRRADGDADAGAGAGRGGRSRAVAHLSHTAQWESARLEAEARLAREAKLRALASPPPPPQAAAHGGLDSPTSTLSFSESTLFRSRAARHPRRRLSARAVLRRSVPGEPVRWRRRDELCRRRDFCLRPSCLFRHRLGPEICSEVRGRRQRSAEEGERRRQGLLEKLTEAGQLVQVFVFVVVDVRGGHGPRYVLAVDDGGGGGGCRVANTEKPPSPHARTRSSIE
ncbi:hypothetical protein ABZP36_031670 [Zizania latifolia]